MKKIILSLFLTASIFNAYAADATTFEGVKTFIENITKNIVVTSGYLFLSMATVAFLWGMLQFILAQREGETKAIEAGKSMMGWGIFSLFIMFSIWGIIAFMQRTIGPDFAQTTIVVPSFQINVSGGTPQGTTGSMTGH